MLPSSCTIISAMPFRPAIRWGFERPQAKALAVEVQRLCGDARVHRIFEWFGRHEREIAELQLAITAIPAPSFAEQARAAWLRERLQPLGLDLSTDAAGNLLAVRAGLNASAPAIAISAHLDTVFPSASLLHVRREQDRLLGPGISDNGAGLAALWALAAAFHHAGIVTAQPLLFVANVCEEGEGNLRGIRHLYRERLLQPSTQTTSALGTQREQPDKIVNRGLTGDAAPEIATLIALDGAGTANIISQGLGSRRFEITISGPGGHSWSDHGVPNPLIAASLAVVALFHLPLPSQPRATLNVGTIEGGTSVNAIPARAVVKVDLRSSDPGHLDHLEQKIRRAVAQACAEAQAHSSGGRLQHAIQLIGSRPTGELPASSPLLAAIRAVDAQLGIQSQTQIASTDANIPLSLGLEAVSLGAGGNGGGAHTFGEWFDPAGREQALERLALLILLLAGSSAEAGSES
jgi:tripeptide aminopeptidase